MAAAVLRSSFLDDTGTSVRVHLHYIRTVILWFIVYIYIAIFYLVDLYDDHVSDIVKGVTKLI